MDHTLTICVLSYNGRDVLDRCLQAVQQTTAALAPEVIVTDNGSSDGTEEMVRTKYPAARLIRNPTNQSFTRAFNRMAREAAGDFVLLVSNDVELQQHTVDRLIGYLRENPAAGAVIPRSLKPDGSAELVCRRESSFEGLVLEWTVVGKLFRGWRERVRTDTYPLDVRQTIEVAQDSCVLLRREAIGPAGPFDESLVLYYTEDDLCHRLRQEGWEIGYEPEAVVHHLHSFTTKRMKPWHVRWLYIQDMLRYSGKYHGGIRTNGILRPLAYLSLALQVPGWAWRRLGS